VILFSELLLSIMYRGLPLIIDSYPRVI
jgi:hypothetical protein